MPGGRRRERSRPRSGGSGRCSSTRSRPSTGPTGSRSRPASAGSTRASSRDCSGAGRIFEYWAHEACLLPIEDYPLFKRRMREPGRPPLVGPGANRREPGRRARGARTARSRRRASGAGRSRAAAGRCGAGSRRSARSSTCSPPGEVAIAGRQGFQRVYDLPERVIPKPALEAPAPTEDEFRRGYALRAVQGRGALTEAGIAEHCRFDGGAKAVRPARRRARRRGPPRAGRGRRRRPAGRRPGGRRPRRRTGRARAPLPVRQPDVGPAVPPPALRLRPPDRGLQARARAGLRVLRPAAPHRRPLRRPRRPEGRPGDAASSRSGASPPSPGSGAGSTTRSTAPPPGSRPLARARRGRARRIDSRGDERDTRSRSRSAAGRSTATSAAPASRRSSSTAAPVSPTTWRAAPPSSGTSSPRSATRSAGRSRRPSAAPTRSRRTWPTRSRSSTSSDRRRPGRSGTPGAATSRSTSPSPTPSGSTASSASTRSARRAKVLPSLRGGAPREAGPRGARARRGDRGALGRRRGRPRRRRSSSRGSSGRCKFSDPETAPPYPFEHVGVECNADTIASIKEHFETRHAEEGPPARSRCPRCSPTASTTRSRSAPRSRPRSCIPGARVARIPSCGHFPWLEQPGFLNRSLRGLIATL